MNVSMAPHPVPRRLFQAVLAAQITAWGLGLPTAAMALAQDLPLADDTYINGNMPTLNYGQASQLVVHNYGPKDGLAKFDASAIDGRAINQATLTFYLRDVLQCGAVTLHMITADWNEGQVTWATKPTFDSAPFATVSVCPADVGEITVDVTNQVKQWAAGTAPAYGFLLRAVGGIKASIDSKERSGGIPMRLSVEPTVSSGPAVLDLANPSHCTIDTPGSYVLDRDWYFTPNGGGEPNGVCSGGVVLSADSTIDLRGFSINGGDFWPNYDPVLRIESGVMATLRNGRIVGTFAAIDGQNATVHLEQMRFGGRATLGTAQVTNSRFSVSSPEESALTVKGGSVHQSEIECSSGACFVGTGAGIEVRDNRVNLDGGGNIGIVISGSQAIIEGNIIGEGGILIDGDDNVATRNHLRNSGIGVAGTGNILDGNIVRSTGVGIGFEQTGNYYGNNRVSAPTPYQGTAGQTDWGGNVSY